MWLSVSKEEAGYYPNKQTVHSGDVIEDTAFKQELEIVKF